MQYLPEDGFSPEEYFNEVVSHLSIPEQTMINKMVQQFKLHGKSPNIESFKSNMQAMERGVNQNASLTAQSRKMILGAYSLGKASFIFWNSPGAPDSGEALAPWLADAGGFIVGAGTTIWGSTNGYNYGNPITNGIAAGTLASELARR